MGLKQSETPHAIISPASNQERLLWLTSNREKMKQILASGSVERGIRLPAAGPDALEMECHTRYPAAQAIT
jgi:hypothetical protein